MEEEREQRREDEEMTLQSAVRIKQTDVSRPE